MGNFKKIFELKGFKIFLLIISCILIAYGMANWEIIYRASACYSRGQMWFERDNYQRAMWNYQEVTNFYYQPKSQWLKKAQKKIWMCRAYLSDWAPQAGPLSADVRKMHPHQYAQYKDILLKITPVPNINYVPAPSTKLKIKQ
jgi:hypothetical protein